MQLYRSVLKQTTIEDNSKDYTALSEGTLQKSSYARAFMYNSLFNGNINIGNNVGSCSSMLFGRSNYNQFIVIPNTVFNCSRMFGWCVNFNREIWVNGYYHYSANYDGMFDNCSTLNSNIHLSNILSANNMFRYCTNLNQNIFIPSQTEELSNMFNGCKKLNQPIAIWDSAINTCSMFRDCSNLNSEITIASGIRNASAMFYDCQNFNRNLNFRATDKKYNLWNASRMFFNCRKLNKTVDSMLVLENLKDCSYMYYNCVSLNDDYYVENSVKNCYMMFAFCTNAFNGSSTISFGKECDGIDCTDMFTGCTKMNPFYAVNTPNNSICVRMFRDCKYLPYAGRIGDGTKNCSGMFWGCSNFYEAPTLPYSIEDMSGMFLQCYKLNGNLCIYGNNLKNFNQCISRNTSGSQRLNIKCNSQIAGIVKDANYTFNASASDPSLYTLGKVTWTTMTNGWYNSQYNLYLYNNY